MGDSIHGDIMATGRCEAVKLSDFLAGPLSENSGEFRPRAYYGEEEDALIFYFRNEPDYAKRVNRWITIYRSLKDHQPVGCQIKGYSAVKESLRVFFPNEPDMIQTIMGAFLGTIEDDDSQQMFRAVGRAAQGVPLECV
jgi:hypothetical protein